MTPPRRIAVLGNSHAACLKAALDADPALGAGRDITFYAAIAELMAGFRATGPVLAAQDDKLKTQLARSAGSDRLDPAGFDGFLLVGMSFKLHPLPDARLSRAVTAHAVRDRITAGYGWRLACELRALTAAPIHVAHMPLPALDRDRFEAETPCPAGYDALAGLWAGVLADRDLTLLRQPADTRFGDLMTRRSFARGSVRMADGAAHGDDERFHMNAQYGRRLLEEWFAALSGTAAPGDEI